MPSLVIDASVLIDLFFGAPAAAQLFARVFESGDEIHAPHLIDLEVTQAVRRAVKDGRITADEGEQWIRVLGRLPIMRHPHVPHLARIWVLRHNISAYDASYIALAESLDAPLLTHDGRLSRAPSHTARIEFIA